jgi:hypothetical protein
VGLVVHIQACVLTAVRSTRLEVENIYLSREFARWKRVEELKVEYMTIGEVNDSIGSVNALPGLAGLAIYFFGNLTGPEGLFGWPLTTPSLIALLK